MIKKIKSSLTIKIFIVTGLLLILCCALTYGFIAWLMPQTYSANLDAILDQRAQDLVADLEKTTLGESTGLFDLFVFSNDVVIQLNDSSGQQIPIPTNMNATAYSNPYNTSDTAGPSATLEDGNDYAENDNSANYTAEAGVTQIIDSATVNDISTMSAAQHYEFTFSDSNEQYKLTVLGGAQAVNQVMETLGNILPWLILVIFIMSVVGSIVYSLFVTRPVIKLSSISQKMSTLDLDWHCDENRNDELGVLAQSLNNLSEKLSTALSELRDANVKLQNDIDKEKRLEQARLEFFSAVSHELKTPITIIKGQLEGMMLGVGTYKDRDKYLARSLEVALSLESMVQEILTVSRMESSGFALHPDEFDFGDMLKKQLSTYEDLLVQKPLQLQTDIEEQLIVNGDKALLQKVINNLIVNAIHYSPAGNHIFIKAWKANDKVSFIIENTGVHIPDTDTLKLFDAFYRVEQSRNRQTGGSGLGLYIVKMILDQHKADYKIENTASGVQFNIFFNNNIAGVENSYKGQGVST